MHITRPLRRAQVVVRTWICADAKLVRVLKLNTLALNFTALNAVLSKSSCGSWLPPACKCLVVNCVSAVERGALSLPNECRYQTAARPVTHMLAVSGSLKSRARARTVWHRADAPTGFSHCPHALTIKSHL